MRSFNETIAKEENNRTEYIQEKGFIISKNAEAISIPELPSYIPLAILGICKRGKAKIKVSLSEYILVKGDLITILPGQVTSIKEVSEDFRIDYLTVSESLVNDTVIRISRLSPLFFIHIRKKHIYKFSEDEIYRYTEYCNLAENRLKIKEDAFQREYIINLLSLFYLDLYDNYKNTALAIESVTDKRKEQLAFEFFQLMLQYHKEHHEVAFYAEKMFITPKYLSTVIKEVSGRSAKDWIIEYIMLEIKLLLKYSALNIQEITVRTNFSNQASLGRFFKKHTGMSPSEYKKEKDRI